MQLIAGRYALQPKPKQGGMSKVYAARDLLDDGKKVALKLFEEGRLETEIIQEAFGREVHALKELQHPAIVQLLDWGIDENSSFPYVVLEWCDLDLSQCVLESEGSVDIAAAYVPFLCKSLKNKQLANLLLTKLKCCSIVCRVVSNKPR